MKKIIAFLLSLIIFTVPIFSLSSSYAQTDKEYFDDGSYITVTYACPPLSDSPNGDDACDEEDYTDISGESSISLMTKIIRWLRDLLNRLFAKQHTQQTQYTKSGYKYCNYFDSNGNLLWSVYLKGTFVYSSKEAVCIASEIGTIIVDSDWELESSECTEDGDSAICSFAMRQCKLGVPLKLIEKEIRLTCDKNGNVK